MKQEFKVGDKVRLKKEFYKESAFKEMMRSLRKSVASLVGKSLYVIRTMDSRKEYGSFVVSVDLDVYVLPPCIFELVEPEKKPVVEVRRVAKVGEWIKIVNAEMTGGQYKNGDVFKVLLTNLNSIKPIGVEISIFHFEYIVLENYEPKKKNDDAFDATIYSLKALSKALSEHVNFVTKIRRWTLDEIVQAKCFLAGELIYAKCRFAYDHNSNRTACYNFETGKSAEAKCAPNDMFNPYIGAVVAYCKTCGIKIPEFITH